LSRELATSVPTNRSPHTRLGASFGAPRHIGTVEMGRGAPPAPTHGSSGISSLSRMGLSKHRSGRRRFGEPLMSFDSPDRAGGGTSGASPSATSSSIGWTA
jgi:hypothetical protein